MRPVKIYVDWPGDWELGTLVFWSVAVARLTDDGVSLAAIVTGLIAESSMELDPLAPAAALVAELFERSWMEQVGGAGGPFRPSLLALATQMVLAETEAAGSC